MAGLFVWKVTYFLKFRKGELTHSGRHIIFGRNMREVRYFYNGVIEDRKKEGWILVESEILETDRVIKE